MERRKLPITVISDVHLGTYGCHALELNQYLESIQPEILILNGDIIDGWQFSKKYFPVEHFAVIQNLLKLMDLGTKIFYISGNHDEFLRKFPETDIGNLKICDKLLFELDGHKTWVFHGDLFDLTTKGTAKIIAKIGGKGYDILILLNRLINKFLSAIGKEKISFSKRVKNSVKKAVKWIGDFEEKAAEIAIQNGYHTVICGHIHAPQKRVVANSKGSVLYLNSGDWVENLTALEYQKGKWSIYQHKPKVNQSYISNTEEKQIPLEVKSALLLQYFTL